MTTVQKCHEPGCNTWSPNPNRRPVPDGEHWYCPTHWPADRAVTLVCVGGCGTELDLVCVDGDVPPGVRFLCDGCEVPA